MNIGKASIWKSVLLTIKPFSSLALLIVAFPLFSYSQTIPVTGQVKDSVSKTGIELATISIINQKGKVESISTTDKDGKFEINTNSKGTFTIAIEFVGYKKKFIQDVSIQQKTSLGLIVLQPYVSTLNDVVITGQSNNVKLKNDRQVFKASMFDNAKGGTAVDLIKNLPSVAVNADGEITLRGSNNFLVLINGKPSLVDAATILSQLPAGSIDNIEIITTPSARFDPDGKAGIINIITKKGTDDGWLVMANAMGGLPAINNYHNGRNPSRFSGDITIGFKKNKWDLNGGFNYLRNDVSGFREGNVYTTVNDTLTKFPSTGERSFRRYNYGVRLAATYTIDKYNTISAGFYEGYKHQDREADLNYTNSKTLASIGQQISANNYYDANNQERNGAFTLFNIDYTHTFSNKSSLSASLLYEGADLSGGTTNNNITSTTSKDTIQFTKNTYNNPLNGYRAKLDYQRKIGIGTLETGYQFRYDTQNGNFDYYLKDLGTANYILDPSFSSAVKVSNIIHAVYAQYSVQHTKWFYSAGLRYETAERNLWFSSIAQPDLSLNNLFPSAQLKYSASNQWKWKAGISKRVKRTTNTELNPFPEREHSETLERGDPSLLPEFVTLAEIGTENNFKKGSWYATAYYQQTDHIIQRLNSIYNDTILNRIYTNATHAYQYGIETGLTLNPTKWWQFLAGINVFESKINGVVFNGTVAVNNSKVAYTCNTTQTFKLPAKWTVQLSVSYLSLRPTAQGEDGAYLSPNLSIKKTTNNNNWTFQAQWLNIDAGMGISNIQRITTAGQGFYTTTNYILEPDVIQFGIGYNFNKKNKKVKLPVSEIGEKEF